MDTRLRKTKTTHKLRGRGKLTDGLIKKLSTYYGLAIRRNVDSVEDMKKEALASYYHLYSTDEKPQHQFCPIGPESWCKWNKAEALGNNIKAIKYPSPLHPDVQQHILPIHEDLTRTDLLERCLSGHTQNANESFNFTVWRLAPKHLHCGLKIVEIAAYVVAGIFNEGYSSILRIMNDLNIKIGSICYHFDGKQDDMRMRRQERRSLSRTR